MSRPGGGAVNATRRGSSALRQRAGGPGAPTLEFSAAGEARIGPIMALPRLLEEQGVSPTEVLRQAGIRSDLFDSPDNRITYESVAKLLATCEQCGNRSDFGLLAGAQFSLEDFGALGELMRNSATVGEALRMLLLHLRLHDRMAFPVLLRVEASSVFLGYSLEHPALHGYEQLQDTSVAIAYRILRELCRSAFTPEFVQISHRKPENIAPYRRVFGANIHFDAKLSGINFAASWLGQRIEGADPAQHALLNRSLLEANAAMPMSFAEEVQFVLHQLLPGGTVTAASVARLFGLSERSLRQKLQSEGTNMQRLLADTRYELARHLLLNTQLSMSQIAAALCYADAAVFSRAFHGWAGVSPRQYRQGQ